jgi:hypothetical protein
MPMTARSHGAPAPQDTTADAAVESALWQQLIRALLEHGLNSDKSSICRLLSTSKAAAALVADCCSGMLTLNLDPSAADKALRARSSSPESSLSACCDQQAAWLKRNGHLLRKLNCRYAVTDWPFRPAFAELLSVLGAGSTPQLKALSGSFSLVYYSSAAAVQHAAASLANLTSLTELNLVVGGCEENGGPAPILSSLQRLSSLRSCDLRLDGSGPGFMTLDAAGLEHLPVGLTSLELSVGLGLHHDGMEVAIGEAGDVRFLRTLTLLLTLEFG